MVVIYAGTAFLAGIIVISFLTLRYEEEIQTAFDAWTRWCRRGKRTPKKDARA